MSGARRPARSDREGHRVGALVGRGIDLHAAIHFTDDLPGGSNACRPLASTSKASASVQEGRVKGIGFERDGGFFRRWPLNCLVHGGAFFCGVWAEGGTGESLLVITHQLLAQFVVGTK